MTKQVYKVTLASDRHLSLKRHDIAAESLVDAVEQASRLLEPSEYVLQVLDPVTKQNMWDVRCGFMSSGLQKEKTPRGF